MNKNKDEISHSIFISHCFSDVIHCLMLIQNKMIGQINEIVNILLEARGNNKTIFICGNGGSASTSSHFACDLAKGTIIDNKKRFKTISLTDSVPLITAWANDSEYEVVFVEQLKNQVQEGDVVIGISGSGCSRNVVDAIRYANDKDCMTIGFTGNYKGVDGGLLRKEAVTSIVVPSRNMQRIEDVHLILTHLITLILKKEIKNEKK